MEKQIEIHAYHGWGFSASFWAEWEKALPEHAGFKCADRGYFGQEYEPDITDGSSLNVLFMHSFGLHWCPEEKLSSADLVVIFNGFRQFHPEEEPARSRSQKVLKGMQLAFRKNPEVVLTQFYSNCFGGRSAYTETGQYQRGLLERDLEALGDVSLTIKPYENQQWIIIDAEGDRIVPGQRGSELQGYPRQSVYHVIKGSGHGLPRQKTKECYRILCEEMPIFRPQ